MTDVDLRPIRQRIIDRHDVEAAGTGDTIVFVEVKAPDSREFGSAAETATGGLDLPAFLTPPAGGGGR